jgi:radical SAM superfamily enzyme YgiQ (UPF0313 family)
MKKMGTMKVAGIFPQKIDGNFMDPDPEESLGIEYILAIAKNENHQIKLFIPLGVSLEEMTKQVIKWQPDVIGLQLYTKHVPDGLTIAKTIKRELPEVVIIAGGPHPSAVPELAMEKSIDVCVIGEGEQTFATLLWAIDNKQDYNTVKGISCKGKDQLIITEPRQLIKNLDSLPVPLRDRRFYETANIACSLTYPAPSELVSASVIASRGCTANCYFCSSPALWHRGIRFRSAPKVIEEIRSIQEQYGVNFILFEDLSFSSGSRQKVFELCQEIIRQKVVVSWWCETNTYTIDKKLLKIMKQAGCNAITFGVESLDEKSLIKMHKSSKQTVIQIQKAIKLANEAGMLVWCFYIIGFPWETKESIMASAQKLTEFGIHRLRLSIATPLPGSPWYREIDKSLLSDELNLYDTNHLVYKHPSITPTEAKELQSDIYHRFYHSTEYKKRVRAKIKEFPIFTKSFEEFLSHVHKKT